MAATVAAVVAISPTGDLATGEFEDAVVIQRIDEVDKALLNEFLSSHNVRPQSLCELGAGRVTQSYASSYAFFRISMILE